MGARERILAGLRVVNKYSLNRLTRRFAGKPRSPLALIIHVGRRSGKVYETPVIARPVADGFVIPLAYGADADWYKNVQVSGYCRIRWNGQEYSIENPQPTDGKTAYFRISRLSTTDDSANPGQPAIRNHDVSGYN